MSPLSSSYSRMTAPLSAPTSAAISSGDKRRCSRKRFSFWPSWRGNSVGSMVLSLLWGFARSAGLPLRYRFKVFRIDHPHVPELRGLEALCLNQRPNAVRRHSQPPSRLCRADNFHGPIIALMKTMVSPTPNSVDKQTSCAYSCGHKTQRAGKCANTRQPYTANS